MFVVHQSFCVCKIVLNEILELIKMHGYTHTHIYTILNKSVTGKTIKGGNTNWAHIVCQTWFSVLIRLARNIFTTTLWGTYFYSHPHPHPHFIWRNKVWMRWPKSYTQVVCPQKSYSYYSACKQTNKEKYIFKNCLLFIALLSRLFAHPIIVWT